jgi:hypothetical protein
MGQGVVDGGDGIEQDNGASEDGRADHLPDHLCAALDTIDNHQRHHGGAEMAADRMDRAVRDLFCQGVVAWLKLAHQGVLLTK